MGIGKINILSFFRNKELYSKKTLIEYDYLFDCFQKNVNFNSHGTLESWINILNSLPNIETNFLDYSRHAIQIGRPNEILESERKILEENLLKLSPWRKGPFLIFKTEIDSEWRSDKKWERIRSFLPQKEGMRICDIGCSNGYYSYKLLGLNPKIVLGVEKTPLYIMQFLATKIYAKKIQNILVIPSNVENFKNKIDFDLVLSMGILYHSKNPAQHIETIGRLLKSNGTTILETIITKGDTDIRIEKGKTFAGMKNIGVIFKEKNVLNLLNENGFKNIECVDYSETDVNEQRSTKWMTGKSLKDFILPNGNTIEGYSSFYRAIFIAQKK